MKVRKLKITVLLDTNQSERFETYCTERGFRFKNAAQSGHFT